MASGSVLDKMLDAMPAYPFKNIGAPIPQDRIDNWRSRSFLCPSSDNGTQFPAKPPTQKASAIATDGYVESCDDGDANLFNGLLCAAGEEIGCDAVLRAQVRERGPHLGQWYRSPNRRWMGVNQCDQGEAAVGVKRYCVECINSFSPDHALGAILYVIVKHDRDAVKNWFTWLDRNAKTTYLKDSSGHRYSLAWPRICDLDRASNACIDISKRKGGDDFLGLHGGACFYLPTSIRDAAHLSDVANVPLPPVTQNSVTLSKATRALLGAVPSVVLDDIASKGEAAYPLHLEATRVLIRMLVRNPSLKYENLPPMPSSPLAFASPLDEDSTEDPYILHKRALEIADGDPANAFYALIAFGPTPAVKGLIESRCPQTGSGPLGTREDWLWLKKGVATVNSMGWDCVFVAKLYNKMRVRKDLWKELAEKLDPVNKILADAAAILKAAQHRLEEAQAASELGARVLNDAHKTLTALGSRAGIESTIEALRVRKDATARVAAAARGEARRYRRHSGHPDPGLELVARLETQHAEQAVRDHAGAEGTLASWDAARRALDRDLQAGEQKIRERAYETAKNELRKHSEAVEDIKIQYAKLNRNLGVWGKE